MGVAELRYDATLFAFLLVDLRIWLLFRLWRSKTTTPLPLPLARFATLMVGLEVLGTFYSCPSMIFHQQWRGTTTVLTCLRSWKDCLVWEANSLQPSWRKPMNFWDGRVLLANTP